MKTKEELHVKFLPFSKLIDYIKIGDALGMGFEYTSSKFIKDNIWKKGELPKFIQHPYWTNLKPGMYTDDSQMSLALIKLMLEEPISEWFDDRTVGRYFLSEFKANPRQGYSTGLYKVLLNSKTANQFLSEIAAFGKSTKNGGCMRAVPIGLLPNLDMVKKFSRFQAEVTHSGTGVDAAELIAVAAFGLKYRQKEMSVINNKLNLFKWTIEHSSYVPDIVSSLNRVEGTNSLGLLTSISVLKLFSEFDLSLGLHELIRKCILLGGDTDTVAAIAAGLYGCYILSKDKKRRRKSYSQEIKPLIRLVK
jgi:ADP-ribosylglycohydrolase